MTPSNSLAQLIDYALAGASPEDRIYIYDAVAALPICAKHVSRTERRKITQIQRDARRLASSIRGNEAAQLRFLELLNLGGAQD